MPPASPSLCPSAQVLIWLRCWQRNLDGCDDDGDSEQNDWEVVDGRHQVDPITDRVDEVAQGAIFAELRAIERSRIGISLCWHGTCHGNQSANCSRWHYIRVPRRALQESWCQTIECCSSAPGSKGGFHCGVPWLSELLSPLSRGFGDT